MPKDAYPQKITFKVVSVTPVEEPKIRDGRTPDIGRARVEARSGSEYQAVLTWIASVASDTPRVGSEFVLGGLSTHPVAPS